MKTLKTMKLLLGHRIYRETKQLTYKHTQIHSPHV